MYKNVGQRIKSTISIVVVSGMVISVFLGLAVLVSASAYEELSPAIVISGALILFVGPLGWWLFGLLGFAYGQLVENTDKLVEICGRMAHGDSNVADNLVEIKCNREWL